jgi:UDPglucose 6-dehydrogenase
MIGLGKLGLPVALAIEHYGQHWVKGVEKDMVDIGRIMLDRKTPYQEKEVDALLEQTQMEILREVTDLCEWEPDIVFVAVQTPHDPMYEGVTELPEERADFDYSYLKEACADLFAALQKPTLVGIISTVLPGTIEREIRPLMNENVRLVYTPQFIAMGTVVDDFLDPEFILLGVDQETAADEMERFFHSVVPEYIPAMMTDIATAEGIKVFYNTFITTKTVLANLYGELSEKLGMDVDDIYAALNLSTKRLLSPRYLRAGVGDGGGCHPRDNIALSWLAEQTDLSYNFFDALMTARQEHMRWLADVAISESIRTTLPIYVFGEAFKPGTNIITGSAARLLVKILCDAGWYPAGVFDPYVDPDDLKDPNNVPKAVYVIATDHRCWPDVPAGSVVIDPFGSYPDVKGVEVKRLGRPNT